MHNCGLQADTIAQSFIKEDFKSGANAFGSTPPTILKQFCFFKRASHFIGSFPALELNQYGVSVSHSWAQTHWLLLIMRENWFQHRTKDEFLHWCTLYVDTLNKSSSLSKGIVHLNMKILFIFTHNFLRTVTRLLPYNNSSLWAKNPS